MIKFFRRIRQRFLSENKVSKYLIYALGEIVLVVIGILLALFINDLRNNQQLKNTEKEVLTSLQLEFEETKKQVELFIQGNNAIINTGERFVAYCNNADQVFDEVVFDSLLYNTAWHSNLKLDQGVYNEMINTGKLSVISNSKTRVLLSKWTSAQKETRYREQFASQYLNDNVLDHLDKSVPWAHMIRYDPVSPRIVNSRNKNIDRRKLATDLRMENFTINQVWFSRNQNEAAEELLKLNIDILEQIEVDLSLE